MKKIGFLMDPIQLIKPYKDTTFRIMLEAKSRGWSLYYLQLNDLCIINGVPFSNLQPIQVFDEKEYFKFLSDPVFHPLEFLDAIFMRKDPPVDMSYIYATYILEEASKRGVTVVNDPKALRDCNEKAFIQWWPSLCPDTIIGFQFSQFQSFFEKHGDIVLKPLNSMGGTDIFRINEDTVDFKKIFQNLTAFETIPVMAQKFLDNVFDGDKRIFLIDGEPVPYALKRLPKKGDFRANLAVGGLGVGVEITEDDRKICEKLKPVLLKKGLFFVGIDVIGNYLTEINVTSPTCVREVEAAFSINIADQLLNSIFN